jgi:uncharacterized protein YecE (DUF72 family)
VSNDLLNRAQRQQTSVRSQGKLFAGSSGFAYASWKPDFYPKNVPNAKFLEYYASRLNLVEVNYTFRQLAKASTFEKWINCTPAGFVFSPKAHNKITHTLRLKNAEEFTRVFLESLNPLRTSGKLGPILFQLPPNSKCDFDLLKEFVRKLPANDRYTFEFRHESWFNEQVFAALRDANIALCFAESEERETPEAATADFVYFRLRKPEYSRAEVDALSAKIASYRERGLNVYALFKHEETPAGAFCAERLLESQCSEASA